MRWKCYRAACGDCMAEERQASRVLDAVLRLRRCQCSTVPILHHAACLHRGVLSCIVQGPYPSGECPKRDVSRCTWESVSGVATPCHRFVSAASQREPAANAQARRGESVSRRSALGKVVHVWTQSHRFTVPADAFEQWTSAVSSFGPCVYYRFHARIRCFQARCD